MPHPCVVSNNCWGYCYCKHVWRIPYNTPFVGVFLFPEDFLSLLENPMTLFEEEPYIDYESKHGGTKWHPVIHYNKFEIQCVHETRPEVMLETWKRRVQRMPRDPSEWRIKFDDRDGCTMDHVERFAALPYRRKILFVHDRNLPEATRHDCVIAVRENMEGVVPSGNVLWDITKRNEYAPVIEDWMGF